MKHVLLLIFMLLPSLALATPKTIRILHVNDLHGFVHPSSSPGMKQPLGGADRLAATINRLRVEKPSILLAAGDMIQGDSWANLNQGAAVIELMNLLRFDAMTTGNHEFDFGQDVLRQRVKQAAFPMLAANVAGIEGLKPYTIVERDGVKIGVIGLVTPDTPITSHPANTKGLVFRKPLDRALELVGELRSRTDLIVLLTHIGHAEDRALAERLLGPLSAGPHKAMQMGNLLIVGGHSHTKVDQPVKIGSIYVAQAWEHGEVLGVIDVTVDQGRIINCTGRLEEIGQGEGDPIVSGLIERYDEQMKASLSRVIGHSKVDLIQEGVRQRETNLGDFLADVVRVTAKADVAIINGGSIRAGIRKGAITMRDIYAILPFNNYIVSVALTGRQLHEVLEHGVSGVEQGEGRFPQVSGLKFVFDGKKMVGQRISGVTIGDLPLDEKNTYSVATLDFMAAGGDGYTIFGQVIRSGGNFSNTGGALTSDRLLYNNTGRWLRDIVVDWLGQHQEIAHTTEGRITELH